MNKYDTYKDSGVEWIGEIPQGWSILQMKRGLTINNGKDYKDIQTDKGYPVIGSGGQFAFASQYLYDGEALLLGRKGTIDKPRYINDKFWTVDTMFYAVPHENVCCKYMFYQSLMIPFKFYSTNTALPSITQKDLSENPMCYPSLSEQIIIAIYLDHKVSTIDKSVEIINAQIDDLKAYRQSLISEVVTKGLNPLISMKDSGVEWIGKIPEEWSVKRLKYLFTFGRGLSIKKTDHIEKGVPVISYGQIHSKENTGTGISRLIIRFIPQFLAVNENCKTSIGDFIFADTSEDREGCGNCVYVDKENVFAGYHSIVLKHKNESKYYAYLFKSDEWRAQIRSRVSGVKVFSITQSILSNVTLIIPPLPEQQAIVAYLDEKTLKIDATIKQLESQREDLKALKQSIISEAVTGKIDLRDWKPKNEQ